MIFEEPAAEEASFEDLKSYVLKRCDLSIEDLLRLKELSGSLSDNEFESRIRVLADFFHRNAQSGRFGKISNQLAYSKKVLLSDSFFENQKTDYSIPTVEETQRHLEQIWAVRTQKKPEDPEVFHERIKKIKHLYHPQEKDNNDSVHKRNQAEKKHGEALRKTEDERLLKRLSAEILSVYKKIVSCELEYKLFRLSVLNVYLYHGETAFKDFLDKVSGCENLTIKDLYQLRDSVITKTNREDENGL